MKLIFHICLISFIGCSSPQKDNSSQENLPQVAQATLQSTSNSVTGSVTLKQQGDQVLAMIQLTGLKKNSTHGIHIHENGVCRGPDFKTAGGHFDPENMQHGDPAKKSYHLGDLGNVTADHNGKATKDILIEKWQGGVELQELIDRSVILHAEKDDFKSQPSGNSGQRIACGVIKYL